MKRIAVALLAVTLAIPVFVSGTGKAEDMILCKGRSGLVWAREGSCKRQETQIPPARTAATECATDHVLLGGNRCISIQDFLATAPLCGDGKLDIGEQCDDGEYNGPLGYCSATCQINCPCAWFAVPVSTWGNSAEWIIGGSDSDPYCELHSDETGFGMILADWLPSDNLYCDTSAVNDDHQFSVLLKEPCDQSLEKYVNHLAQKITVTGGPPYSCPIYEP